MTETDIDLEKEFIPREQSAALRDLGFNEKCMAYHGSPDTMMGLLYSNLYNGNTFHNAVATPSDKHLDVYAPTYRTAFKFFREKYQLRGFIGWRPNTKNWDCHVIDMKLDGNEYVKERGLKKLSDQMFDEYEDAELECLKKLIETAKNK
jgi:hypothetical protein